MKVKYQKERSSFWTRIRASLSRSGVYLGAGAFLVLQLLTSLCFSNSAYAAFSASVSRSGTVTLAEAGGSTIRPSSSGTLGTGSDTVSVTTNCSAGYNLYVSATSTGGTNLKLSGATSSELNNPINYIATSSTATGSETTLAKDTWGVGKTASSFAGLQAYDADIGTLTPLYTGTGNSDYNFYYGANISTAKTPGSYTGEVLYTVVMNDACLKYTLKFDGNGATTNNLPNGTTGHEYPTVDFGVAVDLSAYSGTNMIARTGYTLSGWKVSGGDGTLLPTNNNTAIDDGESSELTLVAQWTANTYTIQYNKGSDTSVSGTAPASHTSQTYGNNVTLQANTLSKTGYHFTGWSRTNSSTSSGTKHYNASTSYAISTLTSDFSVSDTNGATMNLYPVFAANSFSITYSANGGTGSPSKSSETAYYGTNITMPTKNTLAKSGYDFLGWSLSSTATSATWSAGQSSINPTVIKSDVSSIDGGSATVYAVWESSVPECSSSVHPTASTGCKMADGRTWILGNSGNSVTFYNICTDYTNVTNHDATCSSCPSGYNFPKITDFDSLVVAYGGTSYYQQYRRSGYQETTAALWSVLSGGSGYRRYWSSTEIGRDAFILYTVYTGAASGSNTTTIDSKSGSGFVLCYK